MISREFNYFIFKPITFDEYFRSFETSYYFRSVESAKKAYNQWLIFFCQRSSIFYHAQYDYHQGIVEKGFCIQNRVPEGISFSEYGLDESWDSYSRENGLTAHHYEYVNQCNLIKQTENKARLESNIPSLRSSGELVHEFEMTRREITLLQRPTTRVINELWFNNTINNPEDSISQLRKIPYPEYLRTEHWQHVRNAMMLIHKATCQAEGHYEMFETWYFGWEPEIDVHHLSYRNKGNERYSELALLCKDHHKLWHSNATARKPQITILDADWY